MNFNEMLRRSQVSALFAKAQNEVLEPELDALLAAYGDSHSTTVGVGVLTVVRDVIVANEFPETEGVFDELNQEIFSAMMTNVGNALNLDHLQVVKDVKRITYRMAEVMYPGVVARNKARQEAAAA